MQNKSIVITGGGFVSEFAANSQSLWGSINDPSSKISELKPLVDKKNIPQLVKQKRLLKNVSPYHGLGLIALERAAEAAIWKFDHYQSTRLGLYVGSPAVSVFDHINYVAPLKEAKQQNPTAWASEFGKTAMQANGTTLLQGLPNNVLCNGSIALNAKGRNSNYACGENSGQIALHKAAENIKMGTIDSAFAGAFSYHSDPIMQSMYRQNGMATIDRSSHQPFSAEHHSVISNGAVMLALESRSSANQRGSKILAQYIDTFRMSFALGPRLAKWGEGCNTAIARMSQWLSSNGITQEEIGLIFLSGSAIPELDRFEKLLVSGLFKNAIEMPALATLSEYTGNLMEASGLLPICFLEAIHASGKVPDKIALATKEEFNGLGFGSRVSKKKPYTLIIQPGIWTDQITSALLKSEISC